MFEVDEDAAVLYQGSARVFKYGCSSGNNPFIGLDEVDEEQFDYILKNVDKNTPVRVLLGQGNQPVLSGEMQFKSAHDLSKRRWLKLGFKYTQTIVDTARALVEETVDCHIIQGQVGEKKVEEKGEHGTFAREIVLSPMMRQPDFWHVVGAESRYLAWLRTQPCAITGKAVKNPDTGEDQCEAAHVRDIKYGSGMAKKPEYFAIPLHPKIHADQHQKGVYGMWKRAGRPTPSQVKYPIVDESDHVRQWLQRLALRYINEWIQHELKAYFGVNSLSFISQEMFNQYLHDKDADHMRI